MEINFCNKCDNLMYLYSNEENNALSPKFPKKEVSLISNFVIIKSVTPSSNA